MFRITKPVKDVWYITVKHNGLAKWYKGGRHKGIDLRTKCEEHPDGIGTPIYAVARGEWQKVEDNANMGTTVYLKHKDGFISVYGHLSKTNFIPGYREVKAGDVIGYSGCTGRMCFGAHLHFEIRKDGVSLDPEEFIKNGDELRSWARARTLMRVENHGQIKFLTKDGVVDLNKYNCWNIMTNNTWGISESDYDDLLDLL